MDNLALLPGYLLLFAQTSCIARCFPARIPQMALKTHARAPR